MTKAQKLIWNRAVEAVVKELRRGWDDNGHWTKAISEVAVARARDAKVKLRERR